MLVSIVIPVYKSASSLVALSDRIGRVFDSMDDTDYEILFVNDSPFWAKTCLTLRELAERDSRVTAIQLTRNFGQQPATLCGIAHARGDYIVTMDDDLQHAPEDIPKLLAESSHDVVIARFHSKKHTLFKRFTSWMKSYFDHFILGKPRHLALSSFRLFRGPIARFMLERNTPFPFIPALVFEITDDVVNVQTDHHVREEGRSNYSLSRMLKLFSNLIINNSSLLLRGAGYVGLVVALIAFGLAVFIALRSLFFEYTLPGWASTMTAVLMFGGMILLTLGIVGEYLVRIVATTEQRPTYYVREIYRSNREQQV